MYTVLLRAYFDLFGNFENIINVPFYDILNKSAKQKSLTVEEFCYQEIGYEADDLYSAKGRFEKRKLAVVPDNPIFTQIYGENKNIASLLKASNLQATFVKEDIPETANKDIVFMLSNFIENTDMYKLNYGKEKESAFLRDVFFALKLANNKTTLSKMIPRFSGIVEMLLSSAKFSKQAEMPYAFAGTLILPQKISTKRVAVNVCKHIGRRSLTMSPKHYYYVAANLAHYHLSDPHTSDVYQNIVDISNIYNMSIAELIQHMGFHYVNQFAILEKINYFVYDIGGSVFRLINPFDASEIRDVNIVELKRLYEEVSI